MKDYNCPTCKKMIPVDRSEIKAEILSHFAKRSKHLSLPGSRLKKELSIAVKVMWFWLNIAKEIIPLNIKDVSPVDALARLRMPLLVHANVRRLNMSNFKSTPTATSHFWP